MEDVHVCLVLPEWDASLLRKGQKLFDYTDRDLYGQLEYRLRVAERYLRLEHCKLYYSEENLNHFLEPQDTFPGYWGKGTGMRQMVYKGWRTTEEVAPEVFSAKKAQSSVDSFIFLMGDDTYQDDVTGLDIAMDDGSIVHLPISDAEIEQLWRFMADHRHPERNYHPIPKHELKEHGGWPGDQYSEFKRSEADGRTMVPYAIWAGKGLAYWYYDKTLSEFIRFQYEGDTPQHLFHGFHISEAEAMQEMSNNIRKFLLDWAKGVL